MLYVDSSTLLKRYIDEADSDRPLGRGISNRRRTVMQQYKWEVRSSKWKVESK